LRVVRTIFAERARYRRRLRKQEQGAPPAVVPVPMVPVAVVPVPMVPVAVVPVAAPDTEAVEGSVT